MGFVWLMHGTGPASPLPRDVLVVLNTASSARIMQCGEGARMQRHMVPPPRCLPGVPTLTGAPCPEAPLAAAGGSAFQRSRSPAAPHRRAGWWWRPAWPPAWRRLGQTSALAECCWWSARLAQWRGCAQTRYCCLRCAHARLCQCVVAAAQEGDAGVRSVCKPQLRQCWGQC